MASRTEEQEHFYQHLKQFDYWNRRAFCAIVVAFGTPPTHLDLGCGTGAMVKMAREMGIESYGTDLLIDTLGEPSYLMDKDLRQPLELGHKYALVTSIEVGEHIPEPDIPMFIDNLAGHVADGGMLVLTTAGPGQGGEDHQFLRPGYWWRTALTDHGLTYREDLTSRLRLIWSAVPMPMMWLAANCQVFDKGA